jgi:hypothetical protein
MRRLCAVLLPPYAEPVLAVPRQCFPFVASKTKPFKKRCFPAIVGMRRIEQVIDDFVTFDSGILGVGQFHCGTLPESLAIVLRNYCTRHARIDARVAAGIADSGN